MNILWIDDNKTGNCFRYEEEVIKSQGWEIDWAISICEAAHKLQENTYDVIFLDQQFPFEGELAKQNNAEHIPKIINQEAHDTWAGNTIFAWLFDCEEDLKEAPALVTENYNKIKQKFRPDEGNKGARVLILSVNRPTHYAIGSRVDVKRPPFYTKPLVIEELLAFLDSIDNKGR